MTVKVTVPATSANLGAGFDCLGLAVDCNNEIYVRLAGELHIQTSPGIPSDTGNLVYRSMLAAFDAAQQFFSKSDTPEFLRAYYEDRSRPVGLFLKQINRIPATSGLGSSAACIVGGVTAANKLMGAPLSRGEVIRLCTRLDGHPDNVLPAILGGVTAGAVLESGRVEYLRSAPPKEIRVALCTPNFALETRASRRVLPEKYAKKDAVYSLGRAVLTYSALAEGDVRMLKNVVSDRLHEPYRAGLIPDYGSVRGMLLDNAAVAVYLSGAGPTIAAFVTDKFKEDRVRERLTYLPNNWKLTVADISPRGVRCEEVE